MNTATAPAARKAPGSATKLDWAIVASCGLFIFALVVSAYFEPPIRVLHTFQALIYIAVIAGALRHRKWAYGAGISIALFWNAINLFITTFIANGLQELSAQLTGGQVRDSGAIIAVPAALGHFGMIVFCTWAYVRLEDRGWKDAAVLLGSGAAAIAYFIAIIALFGAQYLPLIRKVFRI